MKRFLNSGLGIYFNHLWRFRHRQPLWLAWPALWALWLANHGFPSLLIAFIFILGFGAIFLAIYILHDLTSCRLGIAGYRTAQTPLEANYLSRRQAHLWFWLLILFVFLLALTTRSLSALMLIAIGIIFISVYLFWKKAVSHKKVFFVIFVTWSVLFVFSLTESILSPGAYLLALIAFLWLLLYRLTSALIDTQEKAALKTEIPQKTIDHLRLKMAALQAILMGAFLALGVFMGLTTLYFVALLCVLGIFIYQQKIIKTTGFQGGLIASIYHQYIGAIIFLGILFSYL